MSETDRIDFEVSYKELERAAVAVIDGAHRAAALAWLAEVDQHVDRVIECGELERLVEWSARLDRLVANLPATDLTDHARGYLAGMLDRLDRSAAVLSQQRDVEERAARRAQERQRLAIVLRIALAWMEAGIRGEAQTRAGAGKALAEVRFEIERLESTDRESLLDEYSGALTGAYPPGYLDQLRDEWEDGRGGNTEGVEVSESARAKQLERRQAAIQAMIDQSWDLLSNDHDPHWEGRAVIHRVIRVLEVVLADGVGEGTPAST